MPNNITVKDASGVTQTLRTIDTAGVHASAIAGYDAGDDMLKVKSVQKKFRDSFSGGSLDSAKWDSVTGTGGTITVGSGVLTMGSGTTIASETSVTTKDTFTIPFRVGIGMTMSQRIVNQAFYVEAVSVNASTGVPDGNHSLAWLFDGATVTQAKYEVQNGGLARLASAASTVVTTAAGGIYELEPFADEAWFHSGTLDAVTSRANSYRRHQQIPDPNAVYKVRLRWLNGGTAPATSTNAVVQFITIQDYAELTAEITAGRGNSVAGNAISVLLAGATAATTPIGQVTAVGAVAHDAVRGTTAPIINAARALSAAYTTVATGDVADLITTLQGVLVTRPWQIPELEWSYAAASGGVVNTTDVPLVAAAGAGLRRYITGLSLSNANATATEVVLKDGATVIWRGHLPANAPMMEVVFENPLRTTAATALNFACITTAAAVYVNAQGFTAA
jgi:hypothetical protein